MEIRSFCLNLLLTKSEQVKTRAFSLREFEDLSPGPPLRFFRPERPLAWRWTSQDDRRHRRIPSIHRLQTREDRARALHAFANHELMATELMAWALLNFPYEDKSWRKGTLKILLDEQRHFVLYVNRLNELGYNFGDFLLNDYFWRHIQKIQTPLEFLSFMALTLENANLDHSLDYEEAFRKEKDMESARIIRQVHEDEIAHVRHGARWLKIWGFSSLWETYERTLPSPLSPKRAVGKRKDLLSRQKAQLDEEFVQRLFENA